MEEKKKKEEELQNQIYNAEKKLREKERELENELENERREIEKVNSNNQYRHIHFEWKDGFLHSYCPKDNNITRTRFFLYCWKLGCTAKVKIDMNSRTCEDYGDHISHMSIDARKLANDYPALLDKNWEHLQYDIKGNEKILIWKS